MAKKILWILLTSQFMNAANITDSFLHQGNTSDSLVFYSDTPLHIQARNNNYGSSDEQVVMRLLKTKPNQAELLARLNQKKPVGYKLKCYCDNHDIVCAITYAKGSMVVSVKQQKNWHGIATTVITCKRKVALEKQVHDCPLVVVDCGHGGDQPGAHGLFGLVEKDVVLAIGKQLQECLIQRGYEVLLTREGDYAVALDERTSYVNKHNATLLISLHNNCAHDKQARGIETLYSTTQSKPLADFIHQQLTTMTMNGIVDRGVKVGMLQTLYGCECPAVLVELFFLSNRNDARLIKNLHVQQIIVARLCTAVDQFLTIDRK